MFVKSKYIRKPMLKKSIKHFNQHTTGGGGGLVVTISNKKFGKFNELPKQIDTLFLTPPPPGGEFKRQHFKVTWTRTIKF